MTTYAQLFCTVSDLVSDAQTPGVDEVRMYQAIRDASEFLQKEIGWFIPVTLTRSFNGRGSTRLFVTPPLLAITTIVNDEDTLTTADYILKPEGGFWTHGPYGELIVDPDATLLSAWLKEEDGVTITGRWGKYERTVALTATVADTTQQSAVQTTLKLSSGGVVSPGMVLLIGTEQQLVTGWNDPTTNVTAINMATNVSTSDDTLTVDDGSLLNVGEVMRVGFEQMKIKDKRTNQVSVIRGWNGTGRVTHLDNAQVDVYRTVNVERGVNGTTAAVHANGVAISRYVAPDDVQFLCREIAMLMVNKAKGGYQGREGNTETGMVFYRDAFPQYDIQKIKNNYYIPRAR